MNHTLQVQSVIYGNEKKDLLRAIKNLANAIRVEHEQAGMLGRVTLAYGDASPEPVFSEVEVSEIQAEFQKYLTFVYRFFNFNSGSAKGHNLLGEACCSDYMLIMNPDVILSPGTLVKLMEPFADPSVGMVEARQTPIEHQKEYDVDTLETDWATTACAAFPTEIFRKLNGFDSDTFFLYCDDLDFSWRVRLEGYKIIYQPAAPVFHAKRLNKDGHWKPTNAEIYFSQEATLLMCYKWSNMQRLKQVLKAFKNSPSEISRKAAEHFEQLRREGKLPNQLDPEHKIAKFVGDYYSENRFIL